MLRLIYSSRAVREMSESDLEQILAVSRTRNTQAGVTGLLLYRDGIFLQCLEGDELVVRQTYARIQRDPRHNRLLHLIEERTDQRSFPDWAMEFRRPDVPWEAALVDGKQPPAGVMQALMAEGGRPHA